MRAFLILCLSMFLIIGMGCSDGKNKNKKSLGSKANPVSYNRTSPDMEDQDNAETSEEVEDQTVPPKQLKKAKKILKAATDSQIAEVDAKGRYKTFCAACHGFDGTLGVNGAKDLSASTLPIEESIAQVYFGKGLMTPFKGLLKDHEIVAVSKYIEKELRK